MRRFVHSACPTLLAALLLAPPFAVAEEDLFCAGIGAGSVAAPGLNSLLRGEDPLPTPIDTLRALIIFATNPDAEAGQDCGTGYSGNWTDEFSLPPWAGSIIEDTASPSTFTPQIEGSLTHYFHRMSGGRHLLLGRVYPEVVVSDIPIQAVGTGNGGYQLSNDDILQKVDAAYSFEDHDLDGNGVVDYVFVYYWSPKSDAGAFFLNLHGGVNVSGFSNVRAADSVVDADGSPLTMHFSAGATAFPRARPAAQCGGGAGTVRVRNRWQALQILAHEYYHDIFGASWPAFSGDPNHIESAGWYDLMEGRETGLLISAVSRYKAGWMEADDLTATSFSGDTTIVISDAASDPDAKLIRLRTQNQDQYFALEVRGSGTAYGRTQPEEPTLPNCCKVWAPSPGLLVVHVHEGGQRGWATSPGSPPVFDPEMMGGLFDADGRPDPAAGDDTLSAFENTPVAPLPRDLLRPGGTSTNVWGPFTNPNSHLYASAANDVQTTFSGWTVYNVQWEGPGTNAMRVSIRYDGAAPNGADTLRSSMTWDGLVQLTGDLVVPAGVELTVQEGSTVVVAAGDDRFDAGDDPTRTEPIVRGRLVASGTSVKPLKFTSSRDPSFTHFRGPGQPGSPETNLDWPGFRFELTGCLCTGYGYSSAAGPPSVIEHATIKNATRGVAIRSPLAPNLKSVTFQNIQDQRHIYADGTDIVIPKSYWTEGCGEGTEVQQQGVWDLKGGTHVVFSNATTTDLACVGVPGKADLMVDGLLLTNESGPGAADTVYFRPEMPTNPGLPNAGRDWDGIFMSYYSVGSVLRYADVGYAANPVYLYYPQSTPTLTNSRIHHFADVGVWVHQTYGVSGPTLDALLVERGTDLESQLGETGVYLDRADGSQLLSSEISLEGRNSQYPAYGVHAYFTSAFCAAPTGQHDPFEISGNVITGPGLDVQWEVDLGINAYRVCGDELPPHTPDLRPVAIRENLVQGWKGAGMYLSHAKALPVTCNAVIDCRNGVDVVRGSTQPGPGVGLRSNRVEALGQFSTSFAFRTNDATHVRLGPEDPDLNSGWNQLAVNRQQTKFIYEEATSGLLAAQDNAWSLFDAPPPTFTLVNADSQIANRIAPAGASVDFSGFLSTAPPDVCDAYAATPRQEASSHAELSPLAEIAPEQPPTVLSLGTPRPNPGRQGVTLELSVPLDRVGVYRMEVFDVQGRLVREETHDVSNAGRYLVTWRGDDGSGQRVSDGIYFVRVSGPNGFRAVRKAVVLR